MSRINKIFINRKLIKPIKINDEIINYESSISIDVAFGYDSNETVSEVKKRMNITLDNLIQDELDNYLNDENINKLYGNNELNTFNEDNNIIENENINKVYDNNELNTSNENTDIIENEKVLIKNEKKYDKPILDMNIDELKKHGLVI